MVKATYYIVVRVMIGLLITARVKDRMVEVGGEV